MKSNVSCFLPNSAVATFFLAAVNLSAQTPAELGIQTYAGLTIAGTVGTVYSVE